MALGAYFSDASASGGGPWPLPLRGLAFREDDAVFLRLHGFDHSKKKIDDAGIERSEGADVGDVGRRSGLDGR